MTEENPSVADRAKATYKTLRRRAAGIYSSIDSPRYLLKTRKPENARRYFNACMLLKPGIYWKRKNVLRRYSVPSGLTDIDRSKGFSVIDMSTDGDTKELIATTHELVAGRRFQDSRADGRKAFFQEVPLSRLDRVGPDSAYLRYAMKDEILGPVARYLGMIPVLRNVLICFSPAERLAHDNVSQSFHRDENDYRMMKVWLYVDEVDEESGPLHVISADKSHEVYARLVKDRIIDRKGAKVADDKIYQYADRTDVVSLVGPAGTVVFSDTANAYHFGSRPGRRHRLVVMFYFVTPFSPDFGWSWRRTDEPAFKNVAGQADDEVMRYVLGARS